MVSAVYFCIAYVVVDVLCLVLTAIIARNVSRDSGSELQVRFFLMLLASNSVFVIFDAVWAISVFSQVFSPSDVFLSVVNGINITAIAFTGFFWFGFSLAYFEAKIINSRMFRILAVVPAALAVVLHVIGYFTNQNVIFLPDGTIAYGVVHTVDTIIPLLYLLGATVVALHEFRRATTRAAKRMSLVFIAFMLAPAASGIIDMLVPDMPVAAAGIMISIVFVLMELQESRISADGLTGLNNRRRFDSYLEEGIAHVSKDKPLYLFVMDMDRFKRINDTYGHLEGDHALQLMGSTLRVVCAQYNAFAARLGGDEFAIVIADGELDGCERVVESIGETLEAAARAAKVEYELSCTVGYAICESTAQSNSDLVSQADRMLYQNKRARR